MLTLQKKTKLKILGLVLGLSFLVACEKKEAVEEPYKQDEVHVSNLDTRFLNSRVKGNNIVAYEIKENKPVNVASFGENMVLDLSNDSYDKYINIKDTNLYVDSTSLETSDRWYKKQSHLSPFNINVKTKETYRIFDFKQRLLGTITRQDEYPVYVLPSEKGYGILFQNEVVYILEEDIETSYESPNFEGETGQEIPVLMYHFFYSQENNEIRKDKNFVEVEEFRNQCENLVNLGYTSLTMEEVYNFMNQRANIPVNSFVITIDDGDPSVYKYAYPVLKEYGLNATLFLISGQEDPTLNYDYIMMREDGLELQSHSWLMHTGGCDMGHGGKLLCVDYESGVNDTRMAFDYVDGGFVYCYPFGDVNDRAKNIISDGGALMAFTTAYGKISPGMDLLELPRIRVSGGNSIESFIASLK